MASFRHQMAVQLVRAQPRALHPSIETIRSLMDGFARLLPLPSGVECRPTSLGDIGGVWVGSAALESRRRILYLHGGGYCSGSIRTHRCLAGRLAVAASAPTLLIDYRLAPEHPFPAALDDALHAYRELLTTVEADQLIVAGDSAGGGLALALLMALREHGDPQPAGAFCMSPWCDLAATGESARSRDVEDPMLRHEEIVEWGRLYAGTADPLEPLISPLYGDFSGLPPLLIQVGTRELLLDDSRRVAAGAAAAGVEVTLDVWPDLMHVWQVFAPLVPEATAALEQAGAWIRARTPTGTATATLTVEEEHS